MALEGELAQLWKGGTRLIPVPEVLTGAPMPGPGGVCLEGQFKATLTLMSLLFSLLGSAFLPEEASWPGRS